MKAFIKISLVLAILAAAWYWHQRSAPPAAGGPPMGAPRGAFGGPVPVETARVETKDISITIDAVGTLSAGESAEIRAEVAGAVVAVNFSEGQPVTKGASLVEIDDSLIRAELMKAQAAYNTRETAFGRSDKLKTSGYVSKQDWEENRGSLQEARADIETARIRLEKSKVLAPFDGIAGLRAFSVGDYVQIGELLTTLDAVDPVKITFSAPEKNYSAIQTGQKVSFSVDAWPGEAFSGEVYAVSPRIDQNTRNFEAKATIPNPAGKLRPGMFARVSIVTDTQTGALVVPEQAIVQRGDDSHVFAVRDGKAVFQKVTLGLRSAGSVVITAGLAAEDSVVTAGIMKLRDGAAVMASPPVK